MGSNEFGTPDDRTSFPMTTRKEVNKRQVGGEHYKLTSYQHWDWMADNFGPEYYIGQITKYLIRWKNKNGVQDLMKADHYLEKMIQLTIQRGKNFLPRRYGPPLNTSLMIEQYNCGSVEAGLLLGFTMYSSVSELQTMQRALDLLIQEAEKSQPPVSAAG